uniref:Uncharacterized protein n=1 Tax=Anguilla anguilla TaxID=7936 RepID=A0A0E9XS13_ANGAN
MSRPQATHLVCDTDGSLNAKYSAVTQLEGLSQKNLIVATTKARLDICPFSI